MKRPFLRSIGFGNASNGVRIATKTQLNFRLHLVSTLLAIAMGVIFNISVIEWCLVILACVLVLTTEMLNTAMEFMVDYIQPEFHPVAGKIKDLAAGAVLITSVGALLLGIVIFGQRFYQLI